jgi:2'-5' RNA ligase
MHDTVRCFIAIEIPAEIQNALSRTITQAQVNRASGFRPVRPESIHLTLKFLGDVEQAKLPGITTGLGELCNKTVPFTFQVRGLGAFPTWDRPRTIWAGLQYPPVLADLFRLVDEFTTQAGFPGENRKFSPHLTLARVSEQADAVTVRQKIHALRSISETQFGEVHATRITFFRSILQPGGSVYQSLSVHPFAGQKVC